MPFSATLIIIMLKDLLVVNMKKTAPKCFGAV